MNHFSCMFLCSGCPCTAHWPISHDQMLMLEIMATCESPSFVPIFHFLHCPQSKTCRGVHRQVCRAASAPGGWSDNCLLQGVYYQSIPIQPAGRFISRMLKLMLKQTTCLLVRQLKGIRKWPMMSCHYFLINHRLLLKDGQPFMLTLSMGT